MAASWIVFITLGITLVLFVWGYWRYDVVACIALFALVCVGIVPYDKAFQGFSNPAVITVACVMIITQVITNTGIVEHIVKLLAPFTKNAVAHVGIITLIAGLLSAFMNNVGALALMMPVAIQTAHSHNRSPAMLLMPLAFGSVLGGMTTSIGTPPNLLISAYREQVTGHPFAMFDFSPVGFAVAVACIGFITLLGWRLIPHDRRGASSSEDLFQIQDYITEILVAEDSVVIGKTVSELEHLTEGDFTIVGLLRGKRRRLAIPEDEILQAKDILLIEAGHEEMEQLLRAGKLEVVGGKGLSPDKLRSNSVMVMEAVVPPGSRIDGRSWQRMRIRSRFHVNLLAIARQGKPYKQRLNHVNLRAGDVILLQGEDDALAEMIATLGLLPLQERGIQVGLPRQAILPIFSFGIAIILAALQILPVQIAFAVNVLVLILLNVIPARHIYKHIDWSIIVLLAAMIPVGGALQATGGTEMIARTFINLSADAPPFFIFLLLLVVTMTLSDIMNNAATAVVMAPIAVSIAEAMQVSIDPFLMTVAIGASCSFLTPISHQNNTLVMGPGGYRFTDYWRLGLPVEILVVIVALPFILWVWPI